VSTGDAFLVLSTFLACTVEMVEALTIVLAAGVARGWRSALAGLGAATVVLAVLVVALGPALTHIPLQALRLVVGALLLVFGLQWLRKAILRASGYKALHDEDAIFSRELAEAQGAAHTERAGVDWYGFTLSFKGVLLEGLEVVFIVSRSAARRARSRSRQPAPPRHSSSSPVSASPSAHRWRACPRTR
jgi:Predicted membrane protein